MRGETLDGFDTEPRHTGDPILVLCVCGVFSHVYHGLIIIMYAFWENLLYMFYKSLSCQIKCKPNAWWSQLIPPASWRQNVFTSCQDWWRLQKILSYIMCASRSLISQLALLGHSKLASTHGSKYFCDLRLPWLQHFKMMNYPKHIHGISLPSLSPHLVQPQICYGGRH